jgi:hypothetical protein
MYVLSTTPISLNSSAEKRLLSTNGRKAIGMKTMRKIMPASMTDS